MLENKHKQVYTSWRMITLKHCTSLFKHHTFLCAHLGHRNHFIVGGALRDLLLWISTDPNDIDVTLATTPEKLLSSLIRDKEKTSMFTTEKFWTTTLIPKEWETLWTEYEITPFREETGYSDNRHPDSIERSQNLIDDSKRRDFTINCLYWTTTTLSVDLSENRTTQLEKISWKLSSHGAVYDSTTHTLVIQKHSFIEQCFPHWIVDDEAITQLLQKVDVIWDNTVLTNQKIGIIIDPHQGINDCLQWVIQTVWDPLDRFEEDALRVIRWARFAITLNSELPESKQQNYWFDFRKKTRQAMIEKAPQVASLSFERLNQEITKVFTSPNPFGFISLLNDLNLIHHIFPGLAETIDNTQPTRHHPFDTYNHTLLTLYHLQQRNDDYRAKLAMLYHDVGKPEQYAFMEAAIAENPDNPDRTDYEAHPEISVRMMEKDFKRLCFSKKDREVIAWYIAYHHRPWEILDAKEENRTKKLRKLLSDWWLEQCLTLMDIVISDRLGQYNPLQAPAISWVLELKQQLERLQQEEWRFTKSDLCIGGHDLIETFDIKPGPEMWEILAKVFEWVLSDVNERNEKKVALEYVKGLIW